jgi:pyruvate/2-oxoglutarate dehydrogenase complex dihydrolipoamide acyltransferase (E2) component
MPQIPIIMPQLGEAIAEATVVALHIREGDQVAVDQDVIEVETNKATMNVTSPCPGRVNRLLVKLNESYPVGAVLGYLEATDEDARRLGLDQHAPGHGGAQGQGAGSDTEFSDEGRKRSVQPSVRGLPVPAHAAGASYMSPRMKTRMAELGLHAADLAGVAGSGAGGRVTIQDFEKFLEQLEQNKLTKASSMRVAVADGRAAVQLGGDDGPSQKQRSQSRPGAVLVARTGRGPGGKQRPGRTPDRQQDRPSAGH